MDDRALALYNGPDVGLVDLCNGDHVLGITHLENTIGPNAFAWSCVDFENLPDDRSANLRQLDARARGIKIGFCNAKTDLCRIKFRTGGGGAALEATHTLRIT